MGDNRVLIHNNSVHLFNVLLESKQLVIQVLYWFVRGISKVFDFRKDSQYFALSEGWWGAYDARKTCANSFRMYNR